MNSEINELEKDLKTFEIDIEYLIQLKTSNKFESAKFLRELFKGKLSKEFHRKPVYIYLSIYKKLKFNEFEIKWDDSLSFTEIDWISKTSKLQDELERIIEERKKEVHIKKFEQKNKRKYEMAKWTTKEKTHFDIIKELEIPEVSSVYTKISKVTRKEKIIDESTPTTKTNGFGSLNTTKKLFRESSSNKPKLLMKDVKRRRGGVGDRMLMIEERTFAILKREIRSRHNFILEELRKQKSYIKPENIHKKCWFLFGKNEGDSIFYANFVK